MSCLLSSCFEFPLTLASLSASVLALTIHTPRFVSPTPIDCLNVILFLSSRALFDWRPRLVSDSRENRLIRNPHSPFSYQLNPHLHVLIVFSIRTWIKLASQWSLVFNEYLYPSPYIYANGRCVHALRLPVLWFIELLMLLPLDQLPNASSLNTNFVQYVEPSGFGDRYIDNKTATSGVLLLETVQTRSSAALPPSNLSLQR